MCQLHVSGAVTSCFPRIAVATVAVSVPTNSPQTHISYGIDRQKSSYRLISDKL